MLLVVKFINLFMTLISINLFIILISIHSSLKLIIFLIKILINN